MKELELIKKEEEKLGKIYSEWSNEEKISFIIKNNSIFSDKLNRFIFDMDKEVYKLKETFDNKNCLEYGYITFNQLIKLMKINVINNFREFGLDKFALEYSNYSNFISYSLEYISLSKEDSYIKILMHYEYSSDIYNSVHNIKIGLFKDTKTQQFYIETDNYNIEEERKIIECMNIDEIYNYFNFSDAKKSIRGLYKKDGLNISVPIDILDDMVALGRRINDDYGIGVHYSSFSDKLLLLNCTNNPNDMEDFSTIKKIYNSDADFKNNILIKICDLPVQYAKYLEDLQLLEKEEQSKEEVPQKKRRFNLFRIKKNS